MTCAICNSPTTRGRPPVTAPESLAGKEVCDWCGQRLGQLERQQLARTQFDRLMAYAVRLDDARVAVELQAMWEPPEIAQARVDAQAAAEKEELASALAAIMVTSGFTFEGWRITKYLGFESEEVVLGMGFVRAIGADFDNFLGIESQGLRRKLLDAKEAAFDRLRRDVWTVGGNAIIGVDLDYTMFGTSLVGIIVSGTAVAVEAQG